jgi:protein FAM50
MANFGMGGYVGTSEDQRRILRQQKEREEQRQQFAEARRKLEAGAPALRRFDAGSTEAVEHAFKTETVGLVTRDEFREKRDIIAGRLEGDTKRARDAVTGDGDGGARKQQEAARAKRARAESKQRLSFDDDVDEEDGESGEEKLPVASRINGTGNGAAAAAPKELQVGKDPSVKADFLPDRERERQEEALRAQLRQEWIEKQAAIKGEPLEITYSYWNGSGHRRTLTIKKGDSVGIFLKAALEQLGSNFRELRHASTSSLMYVKEDVILPHSLTFYDLITTRAQGRSGPLFQFDLQEHAATAFDPRMKSKDSHAGKVVERHWYSKHKHIFPYSRWEVFDVAKHGGSEAGEKS